MLLSRMGLLLSEEVLILDGGDLKSLHGPSWSSSRSSFQISSSWFGETTLLWQAQYFSFSTA